MMMVWDFISLPMLYYNEAGYFIARVRSMEDRDKVMAHGPYSICGMPLFIRNWSHDFEIKEDLLRVLPIWIKLPQIAFMRC